MTPSNAGIRSQIARLQREATKQQNRQIDVNWYSFRVAPTCPPSTSLICNGGTCIESASYNDLGIIGRTPGLAWTVPTITRDLTQEDECLFDVGLVKSGMTVTYTEKTWATANAYCGGILLLAMPDTEENPPVSEWKFRLHCYTEEYTTSNEAEARLIEWLADTTAHPGAYYSGNYWPVAILINGGFIYQITGMPLCGVIARNNGTLGQGRFFMPVDAVNRGRSYLWPTDLRPVWVNKT